MSISPLTIHGSWWVPEGNLRFNGSHHSGTLTYTGTEPTVLDIYHEPTESVISRKYIQYDVIWGEDDDGGFYTLFGAVLIHQHNFTKLTFKVGYVLVGAHIESLEEPCFDLCIAEYPYLREWVFDSRIDADVEDGNTVIRIDDKRKEPIMESTLEDGVRVYLWSQMKKNYTRFSIALEQATNFDVEIPAKASISEYLFIVARFTQFLSIALFRRVIIFWHLKWSEICNL